MTLTEKLKKHTKQHKKLFLPYLCEEWGVKPEELTKSFCKLWHTFDNPRIVDNLLVLNVKKEPKYYEVCNQKYNRGRVIPKKNYWKYCKVNQKEDQHISVYSHNQRWIDNYKETGSVSCSGTTIGVDYVYLELDRPTLKEAINDSIKFYQAFPYKTYCSLWYSGNKSVHIQIDASLFGKPMGNDYNIAGRRKLIYNLAHKLSEGLRFEGVGDVWSMSNTEVEELYREKVGNGAEDLHRKKQALENIDPNLYTTNSLIRQPFSYHETGNKQKIKLSEKNPKKRFDIGKENDYINSTRKPWLLHMVYDCYKKGRDKSNYSPDIDEDEVIKFFSEVFEYFDPRDAGSDGWVNGLFSPFYTDTNNSVSVNIVNGYVYDFGNPDHSFSFEQFKEKYENFNKDIN